MRLLRSHCAEFGAVLYQFSAFMRLKNYSLRLFHKLDTNTLHANSIETAKTLLYAISNPKRGNSPRLGVQVHGFFMQKKGAQKYAFWDTLSIISKLLLRHSFYY
jgi:hypothetical protein